MGGKVLELPSDKIYQARAEGIRIGKAASIDRLADYYMREHPDWNRDEAVKAAESILN